jgi:hypothetical protein
MKNLISVIFLFILTLSAKAESVEMAETMRSEGKIYVVIAVLVTILVGLFIYLITIDRKISNIEKSIKS